MTNGNPSEENNSDSTIKWEAQNARAEKTTFSDNLLNLAILLS